MLQIRGDKVSRASLIVNFRRGEDQALKRSLQPCQKSITRHFPREIGQLSHFLIFMWEKENCLAWKLCAAPSMVYAERDNRRYFCIKRDVVARACFSKWTGIVVLLNFIDWTDACLFTGQHFPPIDGRLWKGVTMPRERFRGNRTLLPHFLQYIGCRKFSFSLVPRKKKIPVNRTQ